MKDPVLIPRMTPEERARFDRVLAAVDRNVAEARLAAEARIVRPAPVTERRRSLVDSILSLLGGGKR